MNKICTDLSQSKKLIELGIDVNTADMFWDMAEPEERRTPTVGPISDYYDMEDWAVPAWSLTALMGLIPPGNILLRDALSGKYKCINKVDSDLYNNPVDAAFEMICWLKENNLI